MRVVLVTAPPSEAGNIANALLQERLAACVNILPGIQSLYWWEGRIQEEEENILLIKTRADLLDVLVKKIKAVHSYTVPEVIALEIREGSEEYLDWVKRETRGE